MAPKKKGNKKQQDDWEAELGETVDPIAQAEQEAKAAEAAKDAEDGDEQASGGAGGLMAALRKNKAKKGKKGKPVEDFVEGEDPPAADGQDDANGTATPPVDFAAKAPEEANMEDEDVFGQPIKKGKGGKQQAKQEEDGDEEEEEEEETGGRIKTKKEKEKEKKEREKQRKKEQVPFTLQQLDFPWKLTTRATIGCCKEKDRSCPGTRQGS